MKRITLLFAALALCVTASAQSWSSEWVPRNEFHIDAFGGLSALRYQVAESFIKGGQTDFISKNTLGGGAGLGYTYHFNENWGITTGAELAIYRGAYSAKNDPFTFLTYDEIDNDHAISAFSLNNMKYTKDEYGNETWTDVKSDMTLTETQTLYSVQVPLMLQLMAPLNQRKSNHFYIALGARFLFNVAGNYNRSLEEFWGEKYATQGDQLPTGGTQTTYIDDKRGNISYDVYSLQSRAEQPQVVYGPNQNILTASEFKEQIENNGGIAGSMINVYNPGTWEDMTGQKGGDEGILPQFNKSGKLDPALFNVAASGELGFRWGLGNGWGLYTGLYLDYGFLSPINPASQKKFIYAKNNEQGQRQIQFNDGSLIMMQYDNIDYKLEDVSDNAAGVPGNNMVKASITNKREDIASKFANIGAGLKLKLAFGKAAPKKPQEPQIVYVDRIIRDTVVKTNTVTVRDTVVKTNTIIEKEIIRDTITIIKEVPVEIQKTMADLSNTMFDFDKYVIKEAAKGPLNSVVKWLQENPEVKVEISGHTDSKGSAEYNQKLSENRARAVYEYFISQGVSKWRLAYAGYGKDKPIATNETEEGRAQNRRVELQIIE